ncbi:MAG: peptide ABC transporter [Planctomycetes bacterium]|nr:peptide ABC transporter [Planctomycetota bacterium]
MKVYLMTDLEGVAGVFSWDNRKDESVANHDLRCRRARWLTREVNAAADGFLATGATEVLVNDGHGGGYTIDLDELDPRVEIIHGHERPFWLPLIETCDVTALVGAHAKAATPLACLRHSMSDSVRGYWLNGISMGEMGMQAAIAGHYGIPFVFVSGDYWACREMQKLCKGCVAVPVKRGLSTFSARTFTPQKAQELIRAGAAKALAAAKVKPFKLASPVRFRQEMKEPVYDTEKPPEGFTVLDSHTIETKAKDVIDLFIKLYKYPPDFQPRKKP